METNSRYSELTVALCNNYVLLTLNRPKVLNALNVQMIKEIGHFFTKGYQEVEANFSAVVMTGSGEKAFAAGADIAEFSGFDSESGSRLSKEGHDVFRSIEQFHVPVIAAVNGYALGGGCELTMACHMRIATTDARFGQPEVNLGLIPGYGGTQRLVQLIGKGKALELLLTGDMVTADEALTLGLVNKVVPSEELIPACEKLVNKFAGKGPLALAAVIDSVNQYFNHDVDGLDYEAKTFGSLFDTEDVLEGASAFVEKRKPSFKGK